MVDGAYNLFGCLLGADAVGLSGVHHTAPLPVPVQRVQRDVGAHAPRTHEGGVDALVGVFSLQGFEKAV